MRARNGGSARVLLDLPPLLKVMPSGEEPEGIPRVGPVPPVWSRSPSVVGRGAIGGCATPNPQRCTLMSGRTLSDPVAPSAGVRVRTGRPGEAKISVAVGGLFAAAWSSD
jgi:hypothetical protein